jgi:dethiobiotin synthase
VITWFVAGTDTNVGKTIVTAALAAILGARGASVAVVKPAQTGVGSGDAGDVDEIRRLAGAMATAEGVRLPDPVAPDRAAAIAGVALPSLRDQRDLIVDAAARHDLVLVEGSGGVAVRLGDSLTLLDIAQAVRAVGAEVEWFVVCGARLGTLNHTTLTVDAIARRGFSVRGLVIGRWPLDAGATEEYNRDDLSRYTGVPVLGALPDGAGALAPADFQAQAPTWLPNLGRG